MELNLIKDAEYVSKCPASPEAKRAAFYVLLGIATPDQCDLVEKTAKAFADLYEDYYGTPS